MNKNYLELGGYGSLEKTQTQRPSNLNDWMDYGGDILDGLVNVTKKVAGIEEKDILDKDGKVIGKTNDYELLNLGIDLTKNIAKSELNSAKTEGEKQKIKDEALKQATSILAKYANKECDKMTDEEKRGIANALAEYSPLFKELGMTDKFLEVVKKYNLPTNCIAPPPPPKPENKGTSKLMPAVVGIGTAGVAYMVLPIPSVTVRVLTSAVAGAIAGKYTYSYVKKQSEKVA